MIAEKLSRFAYTPNEAAETLQVSVYTVHRLIKRGHLKRVPHLGQIRISAASFEALLGVSLRNLRRGSHE